MTYQDLFKNKQMEFVKGYAETKSVQSYVFFPRNIEECVNIIETCKIKGLKICSRGSGLSYGDIITNKGNVIVDLTLINKVLSWNAETGIMIVQSGTTFAQIFNISFLKNWMLASCPGSQDITIGGAISNNVHGKDSFKNGNFGNQVLELKLLLASGNIIKVNPKQNSNLFRAVIGGMGLLGIVVEIKLQLKKIPSPFVMVKHKISKNIFDTIDHMEEVKENADFSVAWIDCFTKNNSLGRGFITSAQWKDSKHKLNENELQKSLIKPKRIFGILPAKKTWYFVRPFFKPYAIKKLNFLNYHFHKIQKTINSKDYQTLLFTKYNFMHNQIPDLKHVYRPEGFLELQPILPVKNIKNNLKELILLCQKLSSESLLCGIKVHSSDNYFLSFEVDGYSIGITLQLKGRKKEDIVTLSKEIFAFTSDCEGKIYLAKDEYLDKNYFKKMYPHYSDFLQIKNKFDPDGIFTSDLYKRLF